MVIFVTKNGHRFHMTARQWQWRPVINNRIKLYTHCSTHPPLYIYSFSPSTVFNMQYPIYPIEYEPSLRPTFLHDFSPKISFTRGGGVGCRKKIFLKTFSRNRGIPINNLPYKNYKTIPIITDRYPQQSLEARVPKERREGAKFAEHTNLSLILKQGKGVGSRAHPPLLRGVEGNRLTRVAVATLHRGRVSRRRRREIEEDGGGTRNRWTKRGWNISGEG